MTDERIEEVLSVFDDLVPGEFKPKPDALLPPLQLFNPVNLQGMDVPERRWLVRDWIPLNTVTAIYGDGGTGKSLLAQQLMTATAIGKPWLGLDTERCRSLGVFCEDDHEELWRRQTDINRLYGVEPLDLEQMRWISRVGTDNLLMTFENGPQGELTDFWFQIEAAARDSCAKLIIIDTAADTFGGNENSRPEVRQFIQVALGSLGREVNATIVLCAHPSLSGLQSGSGAGGSTAWSNSVRSRLYLSHAPESGTDDSSHLRRLSRKKANYASAGEELTLEWEAGSFHPHGAPYQDVVSRIERAKLEKAMDEAFLRGVEKLNREGRNVSHSPNAKNYAPKVMISMPSMSGWKMVQLRQAMERLFDAGKIEVGTTGRGSDRKAIRGIVRIDTEQP